MSKLLIPLPPPALLLTWEDDDDDIGMTRVASITPALHASLATRQLYTWAHEVEAQLRSIDAIKKRTLEQLMEGKREIDATPLFDWSSPDVHALGPNSTDTEVVRLMQRAHYPVVRALFWIQQEFGCLTRLHLMRDIITSAHWSSVFYEAMRVLCVVPHAYGSTQHRALDAWAKAQHLRPDDDKTLRLLPFSPGPHMSAPPAPLLAIVRQMVNRPALDQEEMDLATERVRRKWFSDTENATERATAVLHALFMLARLVACEITPSNNGQADCVSLLRAFYKHGCKCTQ